MANPLRTLAKNTAAVFASNLINIGFGLLILSLIIRYLGPAACSNYVLVIYIAEMVKIIADFGVEGIVTRDIARDRKKTEDYVGSALTLRVSIIFVAFIVEVLVAIAAQLPPTFVIALFIATLAQLFASSAMLFISVYKAFEKMEYETFLIIVLRGVTIILVGMVVYFDLGFIPIFIAVGVSQLVRMIIGVHILHRKFAVLRMRFLIDVWKHLIKEAAPLGFSAFFLLALYQVDVYVIKLIGKAEDVSFFFLPHMVIIQLVMVSSAFVTAIFPILSRLAITSREALKVTFDKCFKLIFTLGLLFLILIIKYASLIVVAIGGVEFEVSGVALQILGCTIPFLFLVQLLHHLLISADRQGYVLASFILCFSLNLCLDIIAVPHWGYIGASWATLISYLALFIVSFIFAWMKVIEIDYEQLARPVLAVLPAGLLLLYSGSSFVWGFGAVGIFIIAAYIFRAFTLGEVKLLGEALAHPSREREERGGP